MTPEIIDLTSNINEELIYSPDTSVPFKKNTVTSGRHYIDYGVSQSIDKGRPFEYND